jgi:hypothetical protein
LLLDRWCFLFISSAPPSRSLSRSVVRSEVEAVLLSCSSCCCIDPLFIGGVCEANASC